MADLTYRVVWRGGTRGAGIKSLIAECDSVDQNDTFTLSELVGVLNREATTMNDGATATTSLSTNVVTITQAITDKPVQLYVVGY